MRPARSWLAAALLSLGACPAAPADDPLAPGVVAEVARAGGDAEGDGWSGRYLLVRGAIDDCDCPDPDLCELLLGADRLVDVVQTDGFLTLSDFTGYSAYGLSGAVYADDTFEVAAIYGLDTLVSDGSLYARLAGDFTADGELVGELTARAVATLPDGPVDCRARAPLAGAR